MNPPGDGLGNHRHSVYGVPTVSILKMCSYEAFCRRCAGGSHSWPTSPFRHLNHRTRWGRDLARGGGPPWRVVGPPPRGGRGTWAPWRDHAGLVGGAPPAAGPPT